MTTMKDLWNDKIGNLTIALICFIFIFLIVSIGKVKALKNMETLPCINEAGAFGMSGVLPESGISGIIGINETGKLPPLTDSIYSSLSFVNDTLCVINDPTNSLQPFINGLKELRVGKDTIINIIHLGDSHIQAGYLSGQTMRMLQTSFGNAGRGWIAPLKLSKVNEPTDYFISSNIREWTTGRCIQASPKCPWGIGGIGIQTGAPAINFNLIIAPDNGAGYSFNKVLLYRDRNAMPMIPTPHYSDSTSVLSWGHHLYEGIAVDTFMTTNLLDTFKLTCVGTDKESTDKDKSNKNLYYGFMLMNGHPGVLYHSIGVNGARFTDYTSRNYIRQLALLNPALIIVSLGTNEAFGRNFNKEQFRSQIDAFIQLVKEELPETTLLMTTPAESYKRAYKNKKKYYVRNDNIAKVADVLTSYTKENEIACWDLFSITGGDNSCKKWFEAGMFGRDRIHFSREGYGEQGNLLYKALIRSCIHHETEFLSPQIAERKVERRPDINIDVPDTELSFAEETSGVASEDFIISDMNKLIESSTDDSYTENAIVPDIGAKRTTITNEEVSTTEEKPVLSETGKKGRAKRKKENMKSKKISNRNEAITKEAQNVE
ncbi:MAG: GDSL-type esterase/lipase family protein [Tannerella sp.]|jgi:lysophospholipase L1-like esterase|nr:GDSL-type esterase/lipase family protein [Tannerella sp.]